MTNIERKAIVALPISGDAEYMRRLSRITDEEQIIIVEKVSISLQQADEIVMKVLGYHTIPDDVFIADIRRLIDKNKKAYTTLSRL